MKHSLALSGALLVLLCVFTCGLVRAEELIQLTEIYPTRAGNTKVDLTVRASRVSIPLGMSPSGEELFFEYTGRFYEMKRGKPMLPGPILHCVPGGAIVMNLKNGLAPDRKPINNATMLYTFHQPNVINVHFHGMHSNPNKDDPFITILPGESHRYKISIPRDHMPGLHWYHAHKHGATYLHVMGGLFGPIVVGDGNFMGSPQHPLRSLPTDIMMIHLYRLTKSAHCDGMTMSDIDAASNSTLLSNPQIKTGKGKVRPLPADLYLINAQYRPTVSVTTENPHVLRMAYAAGSCFLNISMPVDKCDFHLIGYDGIQYRKTKQLKSNWLYFTTGTRASVAVVCHEEGVFPVHHAHDKNDVLFYIQSDNWKFKGQMFRFPMLLPRYNPDNLFLGGKRTVYREISFSQADLPRVKPYYMIGQGTECSSLHNSSTCAYDHFQGSRGTDRTNYDGFVVPLHSVVTAKIYGDPTDPVPHPFHMHVNHFQFVSFEARPGGQHANKTLEMYGVLKGQFRDTIPILDGVTTIRWQAATYTGEVVYHCHALHHEDRGMMTSYLVEKDITMPVAHYDDTKGQYVQNMRFWGIAFVVSVAALATIIYCLGGLNGAAQLRTTIAGRPIAQTSEEQMPLI